MDCHRNIIYADHAATSWPKPEPVIEAMSDLLRRGCANPGRSGHRMSIDTARVIFSARSSVAQLLGASDPRRIIFSANATAGLNMVVRGMALPGSHVITSSMEHNSVMRPLRAAEAAGAILTVLPCAPDGTLDPQRVEEAITPATRLIVCTHASNVTGTVMPIEHIARIARDRGVLLCVDAAQTAGSVSIDVGESGIDMLAFTGHKSLCGPQGTGGLYLREGLEGILPPFFRGGTGSLSEHEEQPAFMPDRYESGTPNSPGIAGLGKGIDLVTAAGVDTVRNHERRLMHRFIAGLSHIKKATPLGTLDPDRMTPILSLIISGMSPSQVSQVLDEEFSIMTRPGLHCAPAAHRTLGTFPAGTVRFSFGWSTREEEIDMILDALEAITR